MDKGARESARAPSLVVSSQDCNRGSPERNNIEIRECLGGKMLGVRIHSKMMPSQFIHLNAPGRGFAGTRPPKGGIMIDHIDHARREDQAREVVYPGSDTWVFVARNSRRTPSFRKVYVKTQSTAWPMIPSPSSWPLQHSEIPHQVTFRFGHCRIEKRKKKKATRFP